MLVLTAFAVRCDNNNDDDNNNNTSTSTSTSTSTHTTTTTCTTTTTTTNNNTNHNHYHNNYTDNHHNTSFVAVRELAAVTETARASRRTIINTCNSNDNNSITIISRVILALTFMIIEPPRGSGRRGR